MDETADCLKETAAKVCNPLMTDFKILRIIPFRRQIASPVEFDLNPGQSVTVTPDDIASQKRIIESYIIRFFVKLLP